MKCRKFLPKISKKRGEANASPFLRSKICILCAFAINFFKLNFFKISARGHNFGVFPLLAEGFIFLELRHGVRFQCLPIQSQIMSPPSDLYKTLCGSSPAHFAIHAFMYIEMNVARGRGFMPIFSYFKELS